MNNPTYDCPKEEVSHSHTNEQVQDISEGKTIADYIIYTKLLMMMSHLLRYLSYYFISENGTTGHSATLSVPTYDSVNDLNHSPDVNTENATVIANLRAQKEHTVFELAGTHVPSEVCCSLCYNKINNYDSKDCGQVSIVTITITGRKEEREL